MEEAPSGWCWQGRPGREFLFEIVANKRNGIDVDKFDYFKRDCHKLNMASGFDSQRLMKFARAETVLNTETGLEESQIVYKDKEVLIDLLFLRTHN